MLAFAARQRTGACFAGLNTPGSRQLAHTLTWGINLAVFASIATYVFLKTPFKRQHLRPLWRWSPWMLLVFATLLVMCDLTRHILLDAGIGGDHLAMYESDGSLAVAGRVGRATTWLGFGAFFTSILWFTLAPGPAGVLIPTPPLHSPLV
eukprot:TRINITY_DN28066_c0_g1_i1.p1 TRINITY_DN28066_c0_g1~~TRINITY_DN28066_c0_g1_i1.p1  ORF type:complete len:150 (+),score=18.81 TRINITY_DN28066_c0_g1_i1:231-680(+)